MSSLIVIDRYKGEGDCVMRTNIRIGDVLMEYGYITKDQLNAAIAYQKQNQGMRVGEILLQLGYIQEEQLLIVLGTMLNLDVIDLKQTNIDFSVSAMVPKSISSKHCMLPIGRHGNKIMIAAHDPLDFYAIEDMKSFIQEESEIVLCKKSELTQLIAKAYAELGARKAADSAGEIAKLVTTSTSVAIDAHEDDAPIINLVNSVIMKAYSEGASDIHFEPFEEFLNIRFRVDGQLIQYMKLDIGIAVQLSTRIKILSDLDIAERRIPQDGNFKVQIAGHDIGMRVSVIPTVFGEKLVLRFLAQSVRLDHAEQYGMNEKNFKIISRILQNPHGIIYITGPTGSGKTTTLYMMLQAMAEQPINISTIEDPVERNLAGVNQVQVNPKAGLTFESGLRSMLRQDPDVILVGETRDSETASIAVSAAITGHLVLSTLHTNDAISSVVRLNDMGIKHYLIANAVAGIVAQRLIKKICPLCKESYLPSDVEKTKFPDSSVLYRGTGCSACGNTGYKGRIAIHEILEVDKEIRTMISNGDSTELIYAHVRESGKMEFMESNIRQLVEDGITTIQEYNKHTAYDI